MGKTPYPPGNIYAYTCLLMSSNRPGSPSPSLAVPHGETAFLHCKTGAIDLLNFQNYHNVNQFDPYKGGYNYVRYQNWK